jgi:hypothetical protein
MMIVMSADNRKVGDGDHHRLLLYLSNLTGDKFEKIIQIKKGIWVCKTKTKKWILKEFSSLAKLNFQIELTEKLYSYHFQNTYRFHPVHAKEKCKFEEKTYGLIEYIGRQEKDFSYKKHEYRVQSLQLLKKYHSVTEKFSQDFQNQMDVFDQIEKWQIRLMEFKENYYQLRKWLPKEYLQSFLYWSEWSIGHMTNHKKYFLDEPHCIIHGDVAHHNFILSNKELFLIDFDLAKIASPLIDDLQFSNRILPYFGWSLENLFHYKPLDIYKEVDPFLYALVFPTDILREWNSFIRSSSKSNEKLPTFLKDLSFKEFNQREKFVKSIMNKLKHH